MSYREQGKQLYIPLLKFTIGRLLAEPWLGFQIREEDTGKKV